MQTPSSIHILFMKTDIKIIAAFLAAAMCADGVCDLNEEEMLVSIAESYELPATELQEAVRVWTDKFEGLSHEERMNSLSLQGIDVPAAEKPIVFDCVLEILMADSILNRSEVNFMLAVAEQLCIFPADAVLLLADYIRHCPELSVEY